MIQFLDYWFGGWQIAAAYASFAIVGISFLIATVGRDYIHSKRGLENDRRKESV